MKPGERVVRCFTGKSVDHVPFGVGIGWSLWPSTAERWLRESGRSDLDVDREFGFDLSFVHPEIDLGIFPHFETKTLEENAEFIVAVDERGITTRNRLDGESMPEFLSYPVKIEEDWERLKAERLQPGPGRFDQDWTEFRDRLARTGEAVQVGSFPYGVFGTARDFMGAEELLIAFYEKPAMIKDMMDTLITLWLATWEAVANEVQIDHIHIWEDMSGRQGSLISPAMVRKFMMPAYDRVASFAKSAGVSIVSVDTDGDCSELVPLMMEHGVNMFFPFEVQAGNDVRDYRAKYPKLGMMGGLDKRALARATRTEIQREIDKTAEMVEKGRYIPGFDHSLPPDCTWDNFRYAAEEIKKICYSKGN